MSENIFENQNIIKVDLEKEMRKSYIDYSMSVIVSRALPDVRDGLKPVHRRILYAMYEGGYTADRPYKKCATTVGDVLGKYHPHGDAAVYDSLVRLAQDFSLRYPLIDGQGNFGSVDGDAAAAYRYTEARMSRISAYMLKDIEKETIDFIPNYNEEHMEPSVLPSRFPNLLVNGSSGIAVGMATNIPPHNLTEVIDGVIATIDDPEITIDELMEHIQGPDFPTYGLIMGKSGIRAAYHTGHGKIIMRARADIETDKNGRERIVVTEIPYMVNKLRLVKKMKELAIDKRIEGIHEIRDESDRRGMKIVIELKRDANGTIILNQLYKFTQMQETFGVNMLALVNNQPKVLNLREMIDCYIKHQEEIVQRRSVYDKKKAEDRAHILEGLRIALDHIDEVIRIIRSSYDNAKEQLMESFSLSEKQAQAILDMRLGRLQGLERDKIDQEYNELQELIAYLTEILENRDKMMQVIKDELAEIRDKYGDKRRTELAPYADDIDIEDLIEEEEQVVTLTHFGYIKRLPSDTYRTQRRGGKGVIGLATREEDFVKTVITCSTHAYLLFFTNKGRMFRMKTYEIPEGGRTAKGIPIVNLLQLEPEERVTTLLSVKEINEDQYLLMITENGTVKKTPIDDFRNVRKGGIRAISLAEDEKLISVDITNGNDEIIIGTRKGMAIRFHEDNVRSMGRIAHGVRGINLRSGDYVIGAGVLREGGDVLVVSENGFGKRTTAEDYRLQNRGGTGIKTYHITEKTGELAGLQVVDDSEDIIFITETGNVIRVAASDIKQTGRNAMGVTLMRFEENNRIVSVARTVHEEEEETAEVAGEEEVATEEITEQE